MKFDRIKEIKNLICYYTCEHGLVHDENVLENGPSGNGFTYTPMAVFLGFNVDMNKVRDVADTCQNTFLDCYYSTRYPSKDIPPNSMDNIIGMTALRVLKYQGLKKAGWYFNGSDRQWENWSWLEVIKDAIKYRKEIKEHRNFFWTHPILSIGKAAYKVWPWHRYYIKTVFGDSPNVFEELMWNLHCLIVLLRNNTSAKNLLWIQCFDINSLWLPLIELRINFKNYFEAEHPFNKILAES